MLSLRYVAVIAAALYRRAFIYRNSREEYVDVGEPDTPDAARPRGESSDN